MEEPRGAILGPDPPLEPAPAEAPIEAVEEDAPVGGADAAPIEREAGISLDVEGGTITYYRKSESFAATCNNKACHGRCVLTRAGNRVEASDALVQRQARQGRNRPLGMLLAWLAQNDHPNQRAHYEFRPDRASRIALRRLYRGDQPTFRVMEEFERPRIGDEQSEPEEVP